jgi:hypothetical protein
LPLGAKRRIDNKEWLTAMRPSPETTPLFSNENHPDYRFIGARLGTATTGFVGRLLFKLERK